jgi:hypothetical protein
VKLPAVTRVPSDKEIDRKVSEHVPSVAFPTLEDLLASAQQRAATEPHSGFFGVPFRALIARVTVLAQMETPK